jgi:hypothetical protein
MGRFGNAKKKSGNPRGKIVWVDNTGVKPAPFAQNIPRYTDNTEIPQAFEPYMYEGALWFSKTPMQPDPNASGMPHLNPMWWAAETAPVKVGSFLIYSGLIRVDERVSKDRIVSVPRHTFIAGGGRYIVTQFSYIAPVT